ncbi:diguanylate cyclase domain-containing protein [Pelovirga terrestris]|uniref:Diguanylate cyclase n=1 Tax=Pelovirga terrestris TaxID=2771352 RepID=A0A8J6QYG3_9BACT|nr:diguanylate cyclase [Pelovirga terrestris]MBD1401208.1 diguanylate cyclase [Pelovirga terrestris]
MVNHTTHILIVDDEPSHVALIQRSLLGTCAAVSVAIATNLQACREEIARRRPDIVLLDLNLPDGSSLAFLEQIATTNTFPVLMMTSSGSETLAVEALKTGAIDYLVKSSQAFADMPRTIERCLREWRLQQEHQHAIHALRESERRFRTLLQDIRSVAVQGYSVDGTVNYWNRASEDLYGYSAAEALGRKLCELIIPAEMTTEVLRNIDEMSQSGEPAPSQEYRLKRKDGSEVMVYTSHAVLAEPGRAAEFYCIDIDITERKKSEVQLNKLSQVVEQSPTMVIITDLNGVIEYVNPFFSKVTGYAAADVIGTAFQTFQLNGMTAEEYQKLWRQLEAGEDWHGEVHNQRKNGSNYWERVLISPLRDRQGDICNYISIREDISAHKEYEQQLQHQATHDALTGLVNRSLLKDRITQAAHQAQRNNKAAAVLLLDLDGFKAINDTLGHGVGDELLCEAAARLTKAVRETDTVARLGGDEFVVLLTEFTNLEWVAVIAEKILTCLNNPFHLAGLDLSLSASIGISLCPQDAGDSDNLIRFADIAMYQAKKKKGCFSFYSSARNLPLQPPVKESDP